MNNQEERAGEYGNKNPHLRLNCNESLHRYC